MDRADAGQRLLLGHDGRDVEQSEAGRFAGGTFDPIGIGDAPPEHLVAAAQAEHMAAAAMMRQEIDLPALRAQEREVAAGRFRAGQDDEFCITRDGFARTHHHEIDTGLELQRIEVVEIGDPRQRQKRNLALAGLARLAEPERVLGR